jgi:meiotic recombination protein SPO11
MCNKCLTLLLTSLEEYLTQPCFVKGVLIPQDVHRVVRVESSARFVLLVEKDATFQKLLDEGMLDRLGPCVLITVS